MTRKRSAVLTAGLVLGLLAPTTAATAATAKSANLIKDPGAESAKPVGVAGGQVPVPRWTPLPGAQVTAVKYGTPDFIEKTSPGAKGHGHNFFAGAEGLPNTGGATQLVPLTTYQKWIATGKAKFTLSGWFGGWESQRDYATLTVIWQNAQGVAVGKATAIGDVTPHQRKNVTGLLARSKTGLVPKGATQALVKLKLVRLDGGYDDGYADNLGLVLTQK
jgi:hypothetical protein